MRKMKIFLVLEIVFSFVCFLKSDLVFPQEVNLLIKNVSTAKAVAFNPLKGEQGIISYTVVNPCIVRVRILAQKERELVLRTILNWTERQVGTYQEIWDGKDSSGNIANPRKCNIVVEAQPLPPFASKNSTIFKLVNVFRRISIFSRNYYPSSFTNSNDHNHSSKNGYSIDQKLCLLRPVQFDQMGITDEVGLHMHNLHDPVKCRELSVKITSLGTGVVISGSYQLTAELQGGINQGYIPEMGSGARWYIDNKLVFEDENANPPLYTATLDTTIIPNGEHSLSISICDHRDHRGTYAIKVIIQN